MARKKSARERAEEKRRFYLYLRYEEQMNMLSDEALGRTIRQVYNYANNRKVEPDSDMLVNMLVSVITTQFDIDRENYVETVQQNMDNGAKGGEKSAEVRRAKAETAKQNGEVCEEAFAESDDVLDEVSFNEAVVQKGTTASRNEPMEKNEPDREIDRKTDRVNDRKTEKDKNYYYYSSCRSAGETEDAENEFIHYGQEQHLTTRAELAKIHALADDLMRTYRNKKPTPHDYENVFGYVHTIAVNSDGENYGVYSDKKAQLLRHVFDEAAARSDLNWQYINRIYLNYDKHRVSSVEEAIEYEGKWQRGEIIS